MQQRLTGHLKFVERNYLINKQEINKAFKIYGFSFPTEGLIFCTAFIISLAQFVFLSYGILKHDYQVIEVNETNPFHKMGQE